MNNQEALNFAKERREKISYNLEMTNGLPCRTFYEKQEEMLMQAVPALEKQIPIKPNKYGCCPICTTYGKDDEGVEGDYCPGCGQRLDWSDKR